MIVDAEIVEKAAQTARRTTAGGLQQITPWHLRRAIFADTNHQTATIAARLATRWGRGDFSPLVGELTAEGRLLGLFKTCEQLEVRPIVVSCALRRLLCKSYCSTLTKQIHDLVKDHQLGVRKGGYEIGAHAMRELTKQ